MSLFSQKKTKSSLAVYVYIIVGGLGSLLVFFLIQKSLPLNIGQALEYQQSIQLTRQKIFKLEKILLKFNFAYSESSDNLSLQVKAIEKSSERLQEIPDFFTLRERNMFSIKLETLEVLLTSQVTTIDQLLKAQPILRDSCLHIPKLQNELIINPKILGSNISSDSQLISMIDDLIDNTTFYCHSSDEKLQSALESKIKNINILFQQEKFKNNQIIAQEFISNIEIIIRQKREINQNIQQLELESVALNSQLQDLEKLTLEEYQRVQNKVNVYRLLCFLFILAVTIFIAYKIIHNLVRTNRNIVKILEGFTQELETKVEQRTAQLEESIQNTEVALTQAQKANQAKSTFLANMSHELRTPLNAILGFTQLMCRDSSIGEEHRENLRIINRSGEHLLKLINDILEMSKIEVGQITLNESKFDLYAMLHSLEGMLRLKAEAKNLVLNVNIAHNVPQSVYTDEGKLRQIIINLLGNALKFTEKGSITLTVQLIENSQPVEDKIDFLFSDTYSLHFKIADTGPGIEPEDIERLFSPFEQTKIGRISNEGTGLGLSICQKFVDLMGGELKVQSSVGEGSIFSFNILVRVLESETTEVNSKIELANRRIIGLVPGQPEYRILAVDDVPASRLLLKKLLSGIGFLVQEAGNGQEAVDLWSSWHPDLILMDMRMPIMNGYDATKLIKSQPQGEKTVIIALTASAFEEEKAVILLAGCDDFMRKPFYEMELLDKIGQYLEIDYLYEESVDFAVNQDLLVPELTRENLAVMSSQWRSQLYQAAARVDNQKILQLLSDIPEEYESLAQGIENLVEHFRCDKIIDLTESVN